jgi:hypothetical protein
VTNVGGVGNVNGHSTMTENRLVFEPKDKCSICMSDIKPGNIGGVQGHLDTLEIILCEQCSDGIGSMIERARPCGMSHK